MTKIPGFELHERIGQGGMATVYRATDTSGQLVALKVLSPSLAADPNFLSRFQKEIKLLTKLDHPHIVKVFQGGEANHVHFIAMEYAECGELEDKIKQGIDPQVCLQYLLQIAQGLNYAHEQGYIHRDMKPANILFRADGSLMVSDFGIAKPLSGTQTVSASLTKTGVSIGTPHYMSPEQARGQTLDYRADLYSLGCIFYEMLTQKKCYDAEDGFAICLMHINDSIPQLPDNLQFFQPTLERLLAKNPDHRFTTTRQLIQHLEHLIQTSQKQDFSATVMLPSYKAIPKKPRRKLLPFAIASVLCVGLFSLFYVYQIQNAPQLAVNTQAQSTPANLETAVKPEPSPIPANDVAITPINNDKQDLTATPPVNEQPTEIPPEQPMVDVVPVETQPTTATAPIQPKVAPTAELIVTLLAGAQQDMEANRLTQPKDSNALEKYQKILTFEPNHAQALTGIEKIAGRYVALSNSQLARNNFDKATHYLDKAKQINPNLATYASLSSQISQAKQKYLARPSPTTQVEEPRAQVNPVLSQQNEELAKTYALLIEQAIANEKWPLAESYLGKLTQLSSADKNPVISQTLRSLRQKLEQQVKAKAEQATLAASQPVRTEPQPITQPVSKPEVKRDINRVSSPF